MIWDMGQLKDFVYSLPDLENGQCYLIMLAVRSKFAKEKYGVKIPDTVLEREVVYWYYDDWRDVFIRKVIKLAKLGECAEEEELYLVGKGNTRYVVGKDILGILAVINPADVRKALVDLCNKVISTAILGNDLKSIANIKKRWFGCLHRRSRRIFHTIDIDDRSLLKPVLERLKKYIMPYMVIETPNGYHVIVHLPSLGNRARDYFREFVAKELRELDPSGESIEYIKQGLEPIPGTLYCGHKVRLVMK